MSVLIRLRGPNGQYAVVQPSPVHRRFSVRDLNAPFKEIALSLAFGLGDWLLCVPPTGQSH
jgi:hypothetical protein